MSNETINSDESYLKIQLLAFVITLIGVILLTSAVVYYRYEDITLRKFHYNFNWIAFISLILSSLPNAVSAPAGADEISGQSSVLYASGGRKSFNIEAAANNMKEYPGFQKGAFSFVPFSILAILIASLFIYVFLY